MRAYRETVTIDDPQRVVVKPRVPLKKGQRVELVFLVEDEADAELEGIRDAVAARGVTPSDIQEAIGWARGQSLASRGFII
ncbi:MAG: hypothetical protein OSA97_01885 [Nevskia sp.]|nr:hypothetical protein [Nevskia sp.]